MNFLKKLFYKTGALKAPKMGQLVHDKKRGTVWKVANFNKYPTITIRNEATDEVIFGSINSPIFKGFDFYVED